MQRFMVLFMLVSAGAFAQVATDGITTSASRTVTLAPDSAVYTVDVTLAAGTTVDQAVAFLKDTGITAVNLAGAGTTQGYLTTVPPTPAQRMVHEFQITLPYIRLKDMNDKLTTAAKAVAAAGGALDQSMYLTASDQVLQDARQKVMPDLVAEVRRRAEFLASASGLNLGALQSLSDGSYASVVVPVFRSTATLGFSSGSGSGLQATIAVSAKFGVIRGFATGY